MEARLTDLLSEARVHLEPGPEVPLAAAANQAESAAVQPFRSLTIRIDRYLQAAGAGDQALRSRMTAAAARDLLAQGVSAEPSWAEIIAAVDRSISSAGARDGGLSVMTSARGRVALRLTGAPDSLDEDWGTPPRNRRVMKSQDLSPSHLKSAGAEALRHLHLSRPAQGVAACLCWLAILIVP